MDAIMKQSEYLRYDATALADLIRRGEVTSREVCEAAVERATSVNGSLNAICFPQFSEALAQDFPEQGVFAGVPLLLKDLAQEQAGRPCT
jgi:amidase